MSIAWQKSGDGNITFLANGRQYYVPVGAGYYEDVLKGLRNGVSAEDMIGLVEKTTSVSKYIADQKLCDNITVNSNSIVYTDEFGNEEVINNHLTDKILSFIEEGLPIKPLINMLKKFLENPSKDSFDQGFAFLEHKGLPVCEDGDFLAYKAVKNDYYDKHTGKTFLNTVGSVIKMRRNLVQEDRSIGCSAGLHAGTISYVNTYGNFSADEEGNPTEYSDRCLIVKINPKDIVSVPKDSSEMKLRVCEYLVLSEYKGRDEINYKLASNDGSDWSLDEDEDDDYEYDEDYYEDEDDYEDDEDE